MVRSTLGEDAIIVATREENGGRAVRVTAAIEQEDRYANTTTLAASDRRKTPHFEIDTVDEPVTSADDWLQYDNEEEENAVSELLTDVMLRHSVPDEITDQIISCATVIGMDGADASLTASLEHLYSFRPLPKKASDTALMLVGPPGAGKTLAAAKLAARGVMAGLKIAVISTDTIRAGGIEQLSAFTKLLRIDLQKAGTPKDLRRELQAARGAHQIIIDTGGMNPFDTEEMRDLARLIAAGDIEPVLTMPAGADADESGEIGRIYAAIGARSMLPTRLDIARRMGGILAAAHHGGLIFADASNTAQVADGLFALSPQRLSHLLMPQVARKQQQQQTKKRIVTG